MNDIAEEYTVLFKAVTKCIESLDQLKARLVIAQQQAEQVYIEKTER